MEEELYASSLNIPFRTDDAASISDYGTREDGYDMMGDIPAMHGPTVFAPLGPDEKYDVYDLELVISRNKKAKIDVRFRGDSETSSARPIYQVQKTPNNHFLGKKNVDITVNRNEAWDPINLEPMKTKQTLGYCSIFCCRDQNPRRLAVTATVQNVLSRSCQGGRFTLTPYCDAFDPQRSRIIRDSAAHHFFSINLASQSPPNSRKSPPATFVSDAPYAGGGYFVFDAQSQGRKELLTTLYCTGYESRHKARTGDIVLAELRLQAPVIEPARAEIPAWRRFFRERHATLYIVRRGVDACFTGKHVQLAFPDAAPNKYTLKQGQAQELILAAVTTSLLAIEHDGLEHKKWSWLAAREEIEQEQNDPPPQMSEKRQLQRSRPSADFHPFDPRIVLKPDQSVSSSYPPSTLAESHHTYDSHAKNGFDNVIVAEPQIIPSPSYNPTAIRSSLQSSAFSENDVRRLSETKSSPSLIWKSPESSVFSEKQGKIYPEFNASRPKFRSEERLVLKTPLRSQYSMDVFRKDAGPFEV